MSEASALIHRNRRKPYPRIYALSRPRPARPPLRRYDRIVLQRVLRQAGLARVTGVVALAALVLRECGIMEAKAFVTKVSQECRVR